MARYRNGNGKEAAKALRRSMDLRNGGDALDFFFLAMAHWQLGEREKARAWYDRGIAWMKEHPGSEEGLLPSRAEAEALLGLKNKDAKVPVLLPRALAIGGRDPFRGRRPRPVLPSPPPSRSAGHRPTS